MRIVPICCLLAIATMTAQRQSDTVGDVTITPIAHATVQLRSGNQVVLVDPTAYGGWDGPYPGGVALKNIDVAFVAMNLPFTATPEEAAECVGVFKPAIAYPYHYKGQDVKMFESGLAGSGVEVRLRDWYRIN